MNCLHSIVLVLYILFVQAEAQLDFINGIQDTPRIDCLQHSVELNFDTINPFEGRIFIRGKFDQPECLKDFVKNSASSAKFDMTFDRCGMRRHRSANPRGMMMSTVVVVSFHRHFITHIDKAYNVQCFYLEDDRVVQARFDVSMIPTTDLNMNPPMPTCKYEVLRQNQFGEQIAYASVGDQVYHKWSCDYPMKDMYCMLIHSCTVEDGADDFYVLVDETGCSKDATLLTQLDYVSDLEAGTDNTVFKFADRPSVYFICQIRLSLKEEHVNNICPIPNCANVDKRRLGKRETNLDWQLGEDFDLLAKPFIVLDLNDAPQTQNFVDNLNARPKSGNSLNNICMSVLTFSTVVGASIVLFLSSVIISFIYFWRPKLTKHLMNSY